MVVQHFLEPHIGHLYSSIIADAIKRWNQLIQSEVKVVLSTGTDEHGTKIQRSAKSHNTTVETYCQEISSKYRLMSDAFNISYTDFIRTSENRHKLSVQQFWVRVANYFWISNNYMNNLIQTKLAKKDLIYKSTYEGWYCVSDETFLSDSQLCEIEKDGQKVLVSADSKHPVEWSEESNYIFRLSSFKQDLLAWLRDNGVFCSVLNYTTFNLRNF